uniref:Allergin-1 isoform X3 n=1 Tax=Pogona vitticeps TaxID=103695 RepID=A0ABM5FNZ6_9SAUR
MPKWLRIVFLLLASCLQKGNSNDDDNDSDDGGDVDVVFGNAVPCSEPVGVLIYSPSSETTIGANVTLECNLTANCLPINYTLFFERCNVKGKAIKKKAKENIVFKLTISSRSELASLPASTEDKNRLVALIVAPLLLLLLLLTVVITFPLLILPWCKASKYGRGKGKSASKPTSYVSANYPSPGNCGIYDDAAYGEEEATNYCDVRIKVKVEDSRKEMLTEDTRVTYAEILNRR